MENQDIEIGVTVSSVSVDVTGKLIGAKFLEDKEMSFEQKTDPDFRLKRLIKEYNNGQSIIYCSRCHHCR
jgi:hypothetical protein